MDRENDSQRKPCQNLYQPKMTADIHTASAPKKHNQRLNTVHKGNRIHQIIKPVNKQAAVKRNRREGSAEWLQYYLQYLVSNKTAKMSKETEIQHLH